MRDALKVPEARSVMRDMKTKVVCHRSSGLKELMEDRIAVQPVAQAGNRTVRFTGKGTFGGCSPVKRRHSWWCPRRDSPTVAERSGRSAGYGAVYRASVYHGVQQRRNAPTPVVEVVSGHQWAPHTREVPREGDEVGQSVEQAHLPDQVLVV